MFARESCMLKIKLIPARNGGYIMRKKVDITMESKLKLVSKFVNDLQDNSVEFSIDERNSNRVKISWNIDLEITD